MFKKLKRDGTDYSEKIYRKEINVVVFIRYRLIYLVGFQIVEKGSPLQLGSSSKARGRLAKTPRESIQKN